MHLLQVVTTVDSLELARRLSATLVERRAAACCQIVGPIESLYRWQGKIETATEWQVIAKTISTQWETIETIIRESHPYETPELLATEIALADPAYLRWVQESTGPS